MSRNSTRGQKGRGQSDRDRQGRRERRGADGKRGKRQDGRSVFDKDVRCKFQRTIFENIEDIKRQEAAIDEFRRREVLCPICGKKIEDIESAITDKQSSLPAHFECITSRIAEMENIGEGESVVYIGQGTFAVVCYDDKNDEKSFHIVRKIEWETGGKVEPWRSEISNLFSQVI